MQLVGHWYTQHMWSVRNPAVWMYYEYLTTHAHPEYHCRWQCLEPPCKRPLCRTPEGGLHMPTGQDQRATTHWHVGLALTGVLCRQETLVGRQQGWFLHARLPCVQLTAGAALQGLQHMHGSAVCYLAAHGVCLHSFPHNCITGKLAPLRHRAKQSVPGCRDHQQL